MYQVQEKTFTKYLEAVKYAQAQKADVIEIETGLRRWTPATQVTKKQQRYYQERKAAYDAQERLKASRQR